MSRSGLSAMLLAASLVSSAAMAGEFTTFAVPGAKDTVATAINTHATVTGYYTVNGKSEGFVRTADGAITPFSKTTGLDDVVPTSINNSGWIAGYAGSGQSFLRYPDRVETFQVAGARYTTARAITEDGWIAGTYTNADNTGGSFVRDPVYGDISFVSLSLEKQTSVYGMVDGNYTVGQIGFGAQAQGFVAGRGEGQPVILGLGTSVTAINDSLLAAGVTTAANDMSQAFRMNMHYHVLPFGPKVSEIAVTAMDMFGDVTGYYLDKGSRYHGFRFEAGQFEKLDAPGAGKRTPFSGTKVLGASVDGLLTGVLISNKYRNTAFIWTW
jgi:hypothetical protein